MQQTISCNDGKDEIFNTVEFYAFYIVEHGCDNINQYPDDPRFNFLSIM